MAQSGGLTMDFARIWFKFIRTVAATNRTQMVLSHENNGQQLPVISALPTMINSVLSIVV